MVRVGLPLQGLGLVNRLLLQGIASLVGSEGVEGDLGRGSLLS